MSTIDFRGEANIREGLGITPVLGERVHHGLRLAEALTPAEVFEDGALEDGVYRKPDLNRQTGDMRADVHDLSLIHI